MLSCKKNLEISPYDFPLPENYYSNKQQMNYALTGVYSILKDNALYANHMLGRMGLDADQAYNRNSNDANSIGDYSVSTADIKVQSFWRVLYSGINRANFILKNIDKPTDLTEKERGAIEGETLFLRGYFYFLLVSNFGDVPIVLEPINTSSATAHQIARAPKLEVYKQIVADMEKAQDLVLPIEEIGYGGRVSQSAVWGILARVNLHWAGFPVKENTAEDKKRYAEARMYAKKVMDHSVHKLNPSFQNVFEKLARDEYDIGESIFEVEFYGNGSGIYAALGGFVGVNNGIYNQQDLNKGYGYSYINTTRYTYDVYEAADKRRDWTIAPFYYAFTNNVAREVNRGVNDIMQRNCGKFRRTSETLRPKHKSYTPQNFPILRFSDVLLMFAEADNMLSGSGATTEAYKALNQVRRRGYGVDINTDNAAVDIAEGETQENFLKIIQDERTRELAFESLRKGDLVRWGIFVSRMKDRLAEVNNHVYFFDLRFARATFTNVSARDVVWPIPSYELGVNYELEQNVGW